MYSYIYIICVYCTHKHTQRKKVTRTVLLTQAQPEAAKSQSRFLSISMLPFLLKNDLAAGENYRTTGVMTGLL